MKKRKDKNGRVLKEGESLRKDGRYQYRYNSIDNKRKTVYAKTLDELREKKQEIQADLYNGFCTLDNAVTVHQMFIRCAANRHFLKPRSREVYEICYNKHAKDILGNRKMRDIKYSDMVMYFKYLLDEQHLNISTIRSVNHALVPLFKTALRDGIIKSNPIDGVFADMKKVYNLQPKKRNAVSQEHLNALIRFVKCSKHYKKYLNIFLVLLFTGMRVSEMCALLWSDIDFDNNVIHITKSIAYAKNNDNKFDRLIQTPKSESGKRVIPIFSELHKILVEQKQSELQPVICGEYIGFVFGNKNHLPYTANDIESIFRKVLKSYNECEEKTAIAENREPNYIESCTPHQLRHSFCSMLCEQDINIKVIQEMMGHASVSTTMDIYAEVSENKKRLELSRVEEKISQLSKID